ncbi:MAG: DnaJ domain-containing protein [Rickettsiales bacterium]|nr:DnaJ domain-containing protein [Rickettsiales bacterium]
MQNKPSNLLLQNFVRSVRRKRHNRREHLDPIISSAYSFPRNKEPLRNSDTYGSKNASNSNQTPNMTFDNETKAITFAMSLIALMAKYRNTPNDENHIGTVESFWQYAKNIGSPKQLLTEARNDQTPPEIHAERIRRLFSGNYGLMLESMETLIRYSISKDQHLNDLHHDYLQKIATIWGIKKHDLIQIYKKILLPHTQNPYILLGVSKKADKDTIKKAYYNKVKGCHPDSLTNRAMPDALISLEEERFSLYTKAYNELKNKKHFLWF